MKVEFQTDSKGRTIWAMLGFYMVYRSIEDMMFTYALRYDNGMQRLIDAFTMYTDSLIARPEWVMWATLFIGLLMLFASAFAPSVVPD